MKNEKIIDSWNLINPDSESKDRMLDEILNQNGKLISRNSNRMKKFIPAVICLAVFLSGTIVYAMVTSGGILKLFKANPKSSYNTDVVFVADSGKMKINVDKITGEVMQCGQIIKKQYEDYDAFSSQTPGIYSKSFKDLNSAYDYIGYDKLLFPQMNLDLKNVTVTVMGENDGTITSLYSDISYESESSVSVESCSYMYTEFYKGDISLETTSYSSEFEGVDYKAQTKTYNGREFQIVNSSEFEDGWLDCMVYTQTDSVIYELDIVYKQEQREEVNKIMQEWISNFK